MAKKKRALTIKQKKLAKYYVATGSQTQAAKLAGYSKKTAHVIGHEMLKKPEIKQAVHEALEESLKKAQLKSDHVIEQLRRIAFSDIAQAYNENGSLKHPNEMDEETRAAVQSIEIDEILAGQFKIGDKKKLKMLDRTKALELLGKHFKVFTDVVESTMKADLNLVDEKQVADKIDEITKKYSE